VKARGRKRQEGGGENTDQKPKPPTKKKARSQKWETAPERLDWSVKLESYGIVRVGGGKENTKQKDEKRPKVWKAS